MQEDLEKAAILKEEWEPNCGVEKELSEDIDIPEDEKVFWASWDDVKEHYGEWASYKKRKREEEDEEEELPGTYVTDATWEERTWKEIVKLREDMYWARLGGRR